MKSVNNKISKTCEMNYPISKVVKKEIIEIIWRSVTGDSNAPHFSYHVEIFDKLMNDPGRHVNGVKNYEIFKIQN